MIIGLNMSFMTIFVILERFSNILMNSYNYDQLPEFLDSLSLYNLGSRKRILLGEKTIDVINADFAFQSGQPELLMIYPTEGKIASMQLDGYFQSQTDKSISAELIRTQNSDTHFYLLRFGSDYFVVEFDF